MCIPEDPEQRDSPISERQELMVQWIMWYSTQVPFRVEVPIPSASRNILLLKAHRCVPQRELSSTPGPSLLKSILPPIGCLPAVTGWCRDWRAQFPCLDLGHFWRVIPASEPPIGSDETLAVTSLQVSFTICPILLDSLPHRCISREHSLDIILHFRVHFQPTQCKMNGVHQTRPSHWG